MFIKFKKPNKVSATFSNNIASEAILESFRPTKHVLSLHVDGSFLGRRKKAGWGFVAVSELINGNGEIFIIHQEFGPVITTPLSPRRASHVSACAHTLRLETITEM